MNAEITGANASVLSSSSNEELADAITFLAAQIQAATCRLLVLIAEMDRREAYGDLHFKSCAHWLSWRTGDTISTAREKVRVARKLEACPQVLEAFAEGRVSYSKLRAITRIVTPENEETLLAYALDGSTSQLERIVRSYRRLAPAEQEQTTRQHEGRYLSYHHDDDNMLVLRGRLPPEVGALLVKALAKASEGDDQDCEPSQRMCDALGEVAGAALHRGLAARAGKARSSSYQVMVHVDEAVLSDDREQGRCEVEGGIAVSGETVRRLTCDAPVLEVHNDVCGEKRGCGHEEQGCYSVDRDQQGELRFYAPAGFQLQQQPEAVMLEDHPVEALAAEHEAMALAIATENGRPGWDGITPVDYAGAVGWLLEIGPSP